jgi:protein gp37
LSDVFDAEVSDEWRLALFSLIEQTPRLDWLLLTKRPQVARKFYDNYYWPRNIWLGTTAENQAMMDLRLPTLMSIPARIHFVSVEPMLESLYVPRTRNDFPDWVIVGGESGPHARPTDPEWMRGLHRQCATQGIFFFVKQMARKAPIPDDLLIREFPR